MKTAELLFEALKSVLIRAKLAPAETLERHRIELQRDFRNVLLRSVMLEPPEKAAVLFDQVCAWCACNAIRARMGEPARCICCGGQTFQPKPGGPAE